VRITTRYNENDLLSALFGVIHETGHARYEQNLPRPWVDQPVGLARSTAIHESQSLFFEMQLGRSEPSSTACCRRCASVLAIGRPLARRILSPGTSG
jgi:Zn-dependent M32 family carboxypeptidase